MRIWASVLLVLGGGCTCSDKKVEPAKATAAVAVVAGREALGGALNADEKQSASVPSLAVRAAGPCVAWREDGAVHVRQWSGTAWDVVGGGSPDGTRKRAVESPVVSLAADGTPWVAWKELNREDVAKLRVARLEGKEWKDVGGELGGPAGVRDLVFSAATTPITAGWTEPEGDLVHLQLRELKNGQWIAGRPVGSKPATILRPPSISRLASGTPAVVFLERDAGGVKVRIAKWESGAHAMLVEPDGADADSTVSTASNADGTVLLALTWNAGLRPVRGFKTAAAAWDDLGLPEGAAAGGLARIAAAGHVAALSYSREGMRVAKWANGAWQVIDAALYSGMDNPVPVAVGPDGAVYAGVLDTGDRGSGPAQLRIYTYR